MSINVNKFINIGISLATTRIQQAGFGVGLILGQNGSFGGDLVRSYSDMDGVAADFDSADVEYKMASAYFGQEISPTSLQIGVYALTAGVSVIKLEGTATAGSMTVSVNGQAVVEAFDTDTDTSIAAVAAAIQALADVSTAVASSGAAGTTLDPHTITITFVDGYSDAVAVSADFTGITDSSVVKTTPAVTIADQLDDIRQENNGAYFILADSVVDQDVKQLAAYCEARNLIYVTRSSSADVKNAVAGNVLEDLAALAYDRTLLVYNEGATEYADAAAVGKVAPTTPGESTLAYKSLAGISANAITSTQYDNQIDNGGNTVIDSIGATFIFNGQMVSGEWLDTIRFADWLKANIEARILSLQLNSPKIAYTQAGIDLIESEVRAALDEGVAAGGLDGSRTDGGYVINFPLASAISAVDKNNRILQNLKFTAYLAGAVNKISINGVLSV